MDRDDGYAVQLGERAQRAGLLGHRVGPDHDLDAVVAHPGGVLEGGRAVLRVDRGRGERDRDVRDGHRRRRAPSVHSVEPAQDDALAQRPRADLEAVDARAGPSSPTPRCRRRAAAGPARPRRPAARCAGPRSWWRSWAARRRERRARGSGRHTCPRSSVRRPVIAGERTHRLGRADDPVGRGRPWRAGAARGRWWRARACGRRGRRPRPGRVAGEVVAGDAAGAERQRDRDVGVLVHALRDLEGATADVGDEQGAGRPAEPATGGEEGQARLVARRRAPRARRRCGP